jgi:hypothetical protein
MLLFRTYQSEKEATAARRQAAEINQRLEQLQREIARPRPYHFEIRKAADKKPG